jgi:DNA topoisomerase-1
VHRVAFYEITKNAIRRRSQEPRELSLDLVNAQQARRALDYLVGFNLSPLLWKKVQRGLSAGRVQSPALRMICEREAEIEAFIPQEYWTLDAAGRAHGAAAFPLKLIEYGGKKVEQFSFTNEGDARGVEATLAQRAAGRRLAHATRAQAKARADKCSIDRKQRRATRRRRSPPRRCSRRPRASSASPRSARCASRSSCMKAWTSAKARSA